MQEGCEAEAMAFGGGGGKVSDLKVIQRLQTKPQYGTVLHEPGESTIGGIWWLAGGDSKFDKGVGGLVENSENTEQGEGEGAGVLIFFTSVVQSVFLYGT